MTMTFDTLRVGVWACGMMVVKQGEMYAMHKSKIK
jgi:hypothetical protein